MQALIVIACGGRGFTASPDCIARLVPHVHKVSMLFHGDATGADQIWGTIAKSLGVPVVVVPALWAAEGVQAGSRRNARMLAVASLLGTVQTWALPGGAGTDHMCRISPSVTRFDHEGRCLAS